MEASIRLKNEAAQLAKARCYGDYAQPSPRDILKWNCQLHYNGYFLRFTLQFLKTYPIQPPIIKFVHPMFHPNIYSDGHVCLDIVGSKWTPSLSIRDVIAGLKQLLDYPNPASPANIAAANSYQKSMAVYEKKQKACFEKHHTEYVFARELG